MKQRRITTAVMTGLVLALFCVTGAQNPAGQPRKLAIGIIEPVSTGGDDAFVARASLALRTALENTGAYNVMDAAALESSFSSIGKGYPVRCRDPRCVIDVGTTVGADRMLYGQIDKGENRFGAALVLVDVLSRQTLEQIELASDPGVDLDAFLHAAIARLHGLPLKDREMALHTYFGPQVANEREWAVSSAIFLGGGVIWALANGGFQSTSSRRSFDDDLTGLPSRFWLMPQHGRPAALAHAYSAAAGDAYGVFYNPASVGWLPGREVIVSYQKRAGTDNLSAVFANKATREVGFGQGFLYSADSDGLYSEATFLSSCAWRFNRTLPFLRPFALGVSLKLSSTRYGKSTDDLFDLYHDYSQEGQGFGFGFDIGARAEMTRAIAGSIVLRDVSSFVWEQNRSGDYSYAEFNPMLLLTGGTVSIGYGTNLFAEIQIPLYPDQNWEMAGAIERIFLRYLAMRIGLRKEIQSVARTPWIVTTGMGISVPTESVLGNYISIDAAYEHNQIAPLSHPLNFSLRIGF